MVDLVQVPANVQQAGNAGIARGIAGVAIVAGNSVRKDPNTTQLLAAEKDLTVVEAAAVGIAINSGAPGQPISYVVSGDLDPGGTLVVGETYAVGAGPGAIAPVADILVGDFPTTLGIASTANNLKVNIFQGGTAHA